MTISTAIMHRIEMVKVEFILNVAKERKKPKQRIKEKSCSCSSSIGSLISCFSFKRKSLILDLSNMVIDRKPHKAKSTEPQLPVLQIVKKHNATAVSYWTCCVSNEYSCYEKTVSSYTSKPAKDIWWYLKA